MITLNQTLDLHQLFLLKSETSFLNELWYVGLTKLIDKNVPVFFHSLNILSINVSFKQKILFKFKI